MEKELQEYIENLKSRTFDTKDVKKSILKIKNYLRGIIDCCDEDIEEGEITKEEILKDYLEEYKNETSEVGNFQNKIIFLISQYEACKKIIKSEKKNKIEINQLINESKRRESESPKETLYNTINMKEEMITVLRLSMREAIGEKILKGEKAPKITREDIIDKVHYFKNTVLEELKDQLIFSLQKNIHFLEEYGYIDEYIEEGNKALKELGLSGIKLEKRNPMPDIEYDGKGNIVKTEEFEDMGVIDFFCKENLKKMSVEDLFTLELFWKSKYFSEKMKMDEAFSTIEFLDLWPIIIEGEDKDITEFDDKKISVALKRDLALTYLIKNREAITPELEEKYIGYLKKNGLAQEGNTVEEIEKHAKLLKDYFSLANDVILEQCVLVDKIKNKEINVKNWGIVDDKNFEEFYDENRIIIGMEIPSFRGLLLISGNRKCMEEFFQKKDGVKNLSQLKLPQYKGVINEDYSTVMAYLYLPTSVYFKKYINEKYKEDPSSPLLTQLALNFADSKKIKTQRGREER